MSIILASASPRRRELMALVCPHFTVTQADCDESAVRGATPALLAQNLAFAKAERVFKAQMESVVVGCDTVVALNGQAMGKPKDESEAAAMLRALSGRQHKVHTGVCILGGKAPELCFVETTRVQFIEIPEAEIEATLQTDEAYDKAGAYGIQGWAARFVSRIEGCYYNVMGLPVSALWQALRKIGAL